MDLNLTGKIARRAGSLADHDVLEVGPGPGGLTRALLDGGGAPRRRRSSATARCLPALAEIAAAWPGRLTVLEGDALASTRGRSLTPPVRVVANLPYNVGTELLVRWLTPAAWPPFWSSLTLMFQKEVAERIVAPPGSQGLRPAGDPRAVARRPEARLRDPGPRLHPAAEGRQRRRPDRGAARAALPRRPGGALPRRRARLRPAPQDAAREPQAARPRRRGAARGGRASAPTDRAEQVPLEGFCRLSRLVAGALTVTRAGGTASATVASAVGRRRGRDRLAGGSAAGASGASGRRRTDLGRRGCGSTGASRTTGAGSSTGERRPSGVSIGPPGSSGSSGSIMVSPEATGTAIAGCGRRSRS